MIDMKKRLLTQLKSGHATPKQALESVTMLLDNYGKLKAASDMLGALLQQLVSNSRNTTTDTNDRHIHIIFLFVGSQTFSTVQFDMGHSHHSFVSKYCIYRPTGAEKSTHSD